MRKYISYIMMVPLSLLILSSCNREMIQDSSYGFLGVSLDNDLSADIVTKAGEELIFSIDVLDRNGGLVDSRDNHLTTVDNPFELRVGNYHVTARSGENLNAAFDSPYYEGSTEELVRIRPDKTTEATINCSLANTIFSVEFAGDFSMFTEYEVKVTNGTGDVLVLSNNPDVSNRLEAGFDSKAYFAVTGTLKWELYLTNTDGGKYFAEDTYTEVKAKEHYHLIFSMGEDQTSDGALVLKLVLDNKWSDSVLDLQMDFASKNHLSIVSNESFGAESGKVVSLPEGTDTEKILTLTAAEGIRTISVTHDNDALFAADIPRSIELMGASPSMLAALSDAGFVVADDFTTINLTGLFSKLPVGSYQITFILEDRTEVSKVFNLCVDLYEGEPTVDVETMAAKAGWAGFAQLEGRILESGKEDVVTFLYRKSGDPAWKEVDRSKVEISPAGDTYSAVIFGLEGSTVYQFRAVSDKYKEAAVLSFTTASVETIHNMSFDSWSKNDKFPNENKDIKVWDSANSSGVLTTTTPVDDAISGKAARLESKNTVMFAAGNIFTGAFGKAVLSGNIGATLDWGTPFTGRPLALRGYYKYAPKAIDNVKDPYTDLKGQMDQCQILVCLTNWTRAFPINTATSTFVDFDNEPGIIAFAQFNTSESSSEYVRFTLPLVYRDNETVPTYAIIAAAASRYGDYFTGGKGSVLHIDEFEFVYDPTELTEEEYNIVFSKVKPF